MSDFASWYNETMKRLIKWLALLAAVGIIIYAVYVWRQRITDIKGSDNAVTDNTNTTTDQESVTDAAGESGDQNTADGMGGASEEDTAAIVSTVLNRVKYSAGNLYEAQAVNIVNDFEQAYNGKNQTLVVALFDKSANITSLESSIWSAEASFPISFKFESVEVRGDTSALVTVDEVYYNPQTKTKQTRRRLLELYPENSSYKIGKYFTADIDTPLAGFSN